MLRILTAGESHGPKLTLILEGMPAGLEISPVQIQDVLNRRQQGYGAGPRMTIEADTIKITAGILQGVTTGGPIALEIENKDFVNWQGKMLESITVPRPGHADLTGLIKYALHDIKIVSERSSARETAVRVAAGALCQNLLALFKIEVGGYVIQIGEIGCALSDMPMPTNSMVANYRTPPFLSNTERNLEDMSIQERVAVARANNAPYHYSGKMALRNMQTALQEARLAEASLNGISEHCPDKFAIQNMQTAIVAMQTANQVAEESLVNIAPNTLNYAIPCPDTSAIPAMQTAIDKAASIGDSLGGIIEVLAWGIPPGLGSYAHYDRRLDAKLAHALMSIPGIKGVAIGDAFCDAEKYGSQANDPIIVGENGILLRSSNHAGGIEGGISNGEPIVIRVAFKPIPTFPQGLPSVNLATGQSEQSPYHRGDICPVPRAVPIVEAMVAIVLTDLLLEKLGGDSIAEILPRFDNLLRANIHDLQMSPQTWRWDYP